MNQFITTALSLPECEYTEEGVTQEVWRDGWMMEVHHLRMKTCEWQVCPECGHKVHRHMTRKVRLAHFSIAPTLFVVEVEYIVGRCPECRKTTRQEITFKAEGCMCTQFFRNNILYYCRKGRMTIMSISSLLGVNRNLVKAIDKKRLEDAYGEMKPEGVHRYIGIDEFSLHKNHVYATVVIDCETGEVLFLEEGNSVAQAEHFIVRAGEVFMRNVKAVAMDMNAQYCKAFRRLCPKVNIVYDGFHIIKNYNDRVLTSIRRSEQNRLVEEMNAITDKKSDEYRLLEISYNTLKKSNYLILANRATLEARDEAARAHNRQLYEMYESRGLPIPEGQNKWSITSAKRQDTILASNEKLQSAYTFRMMLQSALCCTDSKKMKDGLKLFIATARKTGIEELDDICQMIERRMDGITSRAIHPISNGPLEGTNNMIKTLRRQAYGFRDTHYFFLKIWDASRQIPKARRYKSQQNCA